MNGRIDPRPLAERDMSRGVDPRHLEAELRWFVEDAIAGAPRSRQKSLGPSEIGIECARRLGYRLAGVAPAAEPDRWLATIGTATHAWLEGVFTAANRRLGVTRFLCERRVTVGTLAGEPVVGSTDLYDRTTALTVDFKIMGKTALTRLARTGPSMQYRVQAHLYARGWAAAGHPVDRVAIWGLPRNQPLRDAVFWCEDYDEQVALDALTRADGIAALTTAAGTDALPLLPTADAHCGHCPYFRRGSTDLTTGCPGDPASRVAGPTPAERLIT